MEKESDSKEKNWKIEWSKIDEFITQQRWRYNASGLIYHHQNFKKLQQVLPSNDGCLIK